MQPSCKELFEEHNKADSSELRTPDLSTANQIAITLLNCKTKFSKHANFDNATISERHNPFQCVTAASQQLYAVKSENAAVFHSPLSIEGKCYSAVMQVFRKHVAGKKRRVITTQKSKQGRLWITPILMLVDLVIKLISFLWKFAET